MAVNVTDVNILQRYISRVMERAEHHANNVSEIALALAGAIVWKKDSDPITVMAQEGEMKNVLWVSISSNRYAFSYNHNTDQIEIRSGSIRGDVIRSFDNTTTLSELRMFFDDL